MNNSLRAAIRKHALTNKITTRGWTDEQMQRYADEHIHRDSHRSTKVAPKVDPKVRPEVKQKPTLKLVPEDTKQAGVVDDAIKALIEAMELGKTSEVDEARVIELIEQHSRKVVVEVQNKETGEVKHIEGAHEMFPVVMQTIAAGVNAAVVGPAGSGKSTIFEQAADALGLEYYFTGAVQQEHKIMGHVDANGTYHRTQFREAFEHGGLFVMEEFDGSSARAMLSINNAVANQWCDFPDGKIAKHEKFVCVMAGNTFGTGASRQYVGRQQLDAATLDRFAFIEVGYDEGLETAMTLAHNPDAGEWVKQVQAFRRKVESAGLRHVVSPRASLMGARLLKQGMDKQMVTKIVLHKGMTLDQLNQIK